MKILRPKKLKHKKKLTLNFQQFLDSLHSFLSLSGEIKGTVLAMFSQIPRGNEASITPSGTLPTPPGAATHGIRPVTGVLMNNLRGEING